MKSVSVLGRYSAIVAAIVLVGVISASILSHLMGRADQYLDMLAIAAFGIIAGTAGSLTQLNGTVKRTAEQDEELATIRQLLAQLAKERA